MLLNIIRLKWSIYSILRQIKSIQKENKLLLKQNKSINNLYGKLRHGFLVLATLVGGSVFFKIFSKARAILFRIILLRLERLLSGLFVLIFRKTAKKIESS